MAERVETMSFVRDGVVAYVIFVVASLACTYGLIKYGPREYRISCETSEFNPDFTTAQREACRKARQQLKGHKDGQPTPPNQRLP